MVLVIVVVVVALVTVVAVVVVPHGIASYYTYNRVYIETVWVFQTIFFQSSVVEIF